VLPGFAILNTPVEPDPPSSTSETCLSSTTATRMTSQSTARASVESASFAPMATSRAIGSGRTSNTVRSKPAFATCVAIGSPRFPKPMKPTRGVIGRPRGLWRTTPRRVMASWPVGGAFSDAYTRTCTI
jgi:hypothetical protein